MSSTAIRDGHRVARQEGARLGKEYVEAGIRLAVDREDGVERLEARSKRLFVEVGRGRQAQAAFEGGPCDGVAVCQEMEAHTCATVRMQERKCGHDGEKKVLEACRSLGHRPVGEMVAAVWRFGWEKWL